MKKGEKQKNDKCVSTMVLLSKVNSQLITLKREFTLDDRGNTLIRNHFQKEQSSLASFQLQEILQLSCS